MTIEAIHHPSHYTNRPAGFHAECIDYTRHMMFNPGNAFKYVYRAGSKDGIAQDIGKAIQYLEWAVEHDARVSVLRSIPTLNRTATNRARVAHLIASGQFYAALKTLEGMALSKFDHTPEVKAA